MWFKNLVLYNLPNNFKLSAKALEDSLSKGLFRPCGKTELFSFGWVPPSGIAGNSLYLATDNAFVLCAKRQERLLPASVINEHLNEKVSAIEQEQSRKVYKKEKDSLKDEIVIDLLPKAFTRQSHLWAYIDLNSNQLVVDASSFNKAELLTTHLRKSLGSLLLSVPEVDIAPAATMTQWVLSPATLPSSLSENSECELREPSLTTNTIRCKDQDLSAEEVLSHLQAGKQVSKLALSWNEQIDFVLQDDLAIKRLRFNEELLNEALTEETDDEDQLAADMAIMIPSLRKLIDEVFKGLNKKESK